MLVFGLPSLQNHEPDKFLFIINYPVYGILLWQQKMDYVASYKKPL
jgi:hypothetical protein